MAVSSVDALSGVGTDGRAGEGFFRPVRKGEKLDKLLADTKTLLSLPLWIKRLLALMISDPLYAGLLTKVHAKTPSEERALVVEREAYRARWHEAWEGESLDFVLTVPHATPAIPTNTAVKATFASCGYALIWNIVRHRVRFGRSC